MRLPEIPLLSRPKGLSFQGLTVPDPRFAVRAEADPTISIFDIIGGEVTAARVASALKQIGPRPVTVELNSPGGDYFEGVAIYNLFRRHPEPVAVQVLGIAASAAAVVAMAGEPVQIARNGQIMVHNSRGLAVGDRNTLRGFADLLERLDASMADLFAARTGLDRSQVSAMLDAETFFDASEALELGFADALLDREAEPVKASATTAPASKRDLEARLRTIGLSKAQALRAAASAWPTIRGTPAGQLLVDWDRLAARITSQTAEINRLTERKLP